MIAFALLPVLCTSGSHSGSAQQRANAPAVSTFGHYSYGFYTRLDPKRDLIAEAEAIARPILRQHRLMSAAELRLWDGRGQLPIAFDRQSIPAGVAAKLRTREDDLAFPTLAALPVRAPGATSNSNSNSVTMVTIRVGVPQERNVAAYAEAHKIGVAIAEALRAPIVFDHETNVRVVFEEYRDWRFGGQVNVIKNYAVPRQSNTEDEIGPDNPPAIEISGPVVQQQDRHGVTTRGMRKLGLPDIHLGPMVPGTSPFWLVSAAANMLAGGGTPDAATGRLEFGANDLGAKAAHLGRELAQPIVAIRLTKLGTPSSPTGNAVLSIGFEGEPSLSLFERQVLVRDAFYGSPFAGLSAEDATRLSLAVARAKAKFIELEQSKAKLKETGKRVFVAFRADLDVKSVHEGNAYGSWSPTWDEVIAWPGDKGGFLTRRWIGDPRHSGTVFKYEPPIVIGNQRFGHKDSNGTHELVDDVLVVDRAGSAQGGEVSALLKTLFPRITVKQK